MKSTFEARTGLLSYEEARKLWKILSKSGRDHSFEELGCEGGTDIELVMKSVANGDLYSLSLPAYCYAFKIFTFFTPFSSLQFPGCLTSFLIGGLDRPIPEYGWESTIRITFVPTGGRIPITFIYSIDNTLKFMGRSFDYCHTISMCYLPFTTAGLLTGSTDETIPSEELIERTIADLWIEFGLPITEDEAVLEFVSHPTNRAVCVDPQASPWGWAEFESMLRDLFAASDEQRVIIGSSANPGFLSSPVSLAEDAKELARSVAAVAAYERYDVRYNATMAMSWKAREKLRKKWKKPLLHEVGTLKLKDGNEGNVKIVIEKEGYVFAIEFTEVEAIESFVASKIYSSVPWEMEE